MSRLAAKPSWYNVSKKLFLLVILWYVNATSYENQSRLKFMFSKKAIKIDEIFTVDLTFTISKCQIDGEEFVHFCGLLRKHELYEHCISFDNSEM